MKKNNLFMKFLTYSYGSIIGLAIGFMTTIISTRLLNPEDFGKSSLFLLAVNVIMILVIFGTDQTFMRFFNEELESKRSGLLYNTIKLPMIILLIFSFLILFFYEKISFLLFGEENFILTWFLIIGIFSQTILRFSTLVIRMNQRGNVFSLLEILKRLFQLFLLVLIFFLIGASFEIVIYSTVISYLLIAIIAIIIEKKFWSVKAALKIKELKHSKLEIIKYSYPLSITVLITWLFQSFDQLALRHWSTFEELGLYSAAFKIIALLTVVQVAFSTFWTPICYEKFEKTPEKKDFFLKTTNLISLTMFFISILVIMFKDIIILLLGSDYKAASAIIPFLVFIPLMYTISETTVIGINFYKKPKWHILIALVSLIVNIIGNTILVPTYGGLGAAIGTAISYVVFFSLRTLISIKYYKVNYNLVNIYIMIVIIFIYAIYPIVSFQINFLVGIVVLLINFFLYRKDIFIIYKDFRDINK